MLFASIFRLLKELTMSENRPMEQLCARIAADRDHVCPHLYTQMIPAKILNTFSEQNF